MNLRKKVAAYCRVSTTSEGQFNSFENQKHYFEEYFQDQNKFELIELYSDRESGTDFINREGFLKMIHDAGIDREEVRGQNVFFPSGRTPLFEEIYITNSSRFSRNIEIISLLRQLSSKGVSVISTDGSLNTRDRPDDFRTIIDMGFNQTESLDKSRKVREGHQKSARRGKLFGLTGLYGYDYSPMTKEVRVVPEEAENVRLIFDLYLKGLGEQRIANHLEQNGILTRKGKPFKRVTIRKMLSNEKYYGSLVRNKINQGTVFNRHKTHRVRPENEWIVTENRFEAIISKEVYEKAQEIRASKINHETQKGRNHGKTEFAGRIVCDLCGKNYVMNIDKTRYYACTTKRQKGAKTCPSISLRLSFLEEYIQDYMREELRNDLLGTKSSGINELAQEIEYLEQSLDIKNDELVDDLNKELIHLKEKRRRLGHAYTAEAIEEEEFNIENDKLKKEISGLEEAIRINSRNNDEIRLEIERLVAIVEEINNVVVQERYTREEVVNAIVRIRVSRNKKKPTMPQLTVTWNYSNLSGIGPL